MQRVSTTFKHPTVALDGDLQGETLAWIGGISANKILQFKLVLAKFTSLLTHLFLLANLL